MYTTSMTLFFFFFEPKSCFRNAMEIDIGKWVMKLKWYFLTICIKLGDDFEVEMSVK